MMEQQMMPPSDPLAMDPLQPPPQASAKVFCGNLSWSVGQDELLAHMSQAGQVMSAEVMYERSGRSRGWGIVEYSTVDEAMMAIQTLHDSDLMGEDSRFMIVDF